MPESQREMAPRQSWSSEDLTSSEKIVIRRIINPAIYVEKPIVPPLRKTSPLTNINNDSDDENTTSSRSNSTVVCDRSVKKCTCISNPVSCQCHLSESVDKKSESWDNISACSSSSADSQITVKSKDLLIEIDSEMKLSLGSINTDRTINLDAREKEEKIKNWLKKKERELKHQKLEEERKKQEEERQKQIKIEQKKETYIRWKANKRLEDERIRKEKERKEAERIRLAEEKQKKQEENEIKFQLWLKQKKQMEIEKKIQHKMHQVRLYEEKQKRLEENEKAFHEWLKISKYRPKPIPLNKGLQSLCSSTSVTYINPEPWIPNVETEKPLSSK